MSENSKPTCGFIVFATLVLAAVTILIQRQLHQSTNIFIPVIVGGTLEQIDQQVAALDRQYDAQMAELIRRVHTELIALTVFILVMFCVFFGLKFQSGIGM